MKVVLIDDERAMLMVLKKMLSFIPGIEISGCFQDSLQALESLKRESADIAFADIEMPGANGIEFAGRVQSLGLQTQIVFLTSHKEYALEAFDVDAIDYLVKPVSQERLERTIYKAKTSAGMPKGHDTSDRKPLLYYYGLGCEELRGADGNPVKWISAKSKELFSYLVFHNGRLVSRAMIIDDVFEHMDIRNSDSYLNTAVYQLRKALEPYQAKSVVMTNGDSYGLNLHNVEVDFLDFERKVNTYLDHGITDFREAAETENSYHGDLFGDKVYTWGIIKKEQLFEVYSSFAKRLAESLLNVGENGKACHIIKKLINRNNLDEEANRILMRIYHQNRDRKALLLHYAHYKKTLYDELGTQPDPTTKELFEKFTS